MGIAEIGVIGGTGFYQLLDGANELTVQTPYGTTSDVITVGEFHGRQCAFIPRHGRRHSIPPHVIPYRANIFALKELGVQWVIGACAAGALTDQHEVGDIVFADQLVDFTHGTRKDSYYDGPITTHIGFSEPYCRTMRETAATVAQRLELPCHTSGTVVVIAGPRFSTRAESEFYAAQGWHLENMTQYPEAVLARELTLSYLNISLVTNSHIRARTEKTGELADAPEVVKVLNERLAGLKELVAGIIEQLPPGEERPEAIRHALNNARWVR